MLIRRDLQTITGRHNVLIRVFRELAHAREPADPRVLIEGVRLLQEAHRAGLRVTAVAVAARVLDEADPKSAIQELLADLAGHGARVVRVANHVIDALSPAATSTGVVAIAERRLEPLAALLSPAPALVIVLAGVQDPGNVGAVVRSAEATGATGVVAGAGTADPLGWKALRGSMGSAFRVPIVRANDTMDAIESLVTAGVRTIVMEPQRRRSLFEVDLRGPTAVVLGAEGQGLPPGLDGVATERVSIPMRKPVESLNVAVAAALVLYESLRQRA